MSRYVVTAGYVTVTTAVPGGRAEVDVPRGATLPDDVPVEQRETLLRLDHVTVAEPAGEPSAPAVPIGSDVDLDLDAAPDEGDQVPDASVPTTLEWVGTDKARAQRAWDVEAGKGSAARSTLLSRLEAILGA